MANSPPNKQFEGQTGFPTPNAPPEDSGCRVFIIPSDEEWFALFMAAALQLTHEYNWFTNGDLTPAEAASSWSDIIEAAYQRALLGTCLIDVPAPYWDLDSADDADDQMPVETQIWYGEIVALPEMALLPSDDLTFLDNLGIWLIAGFIAFSGQVGAAIAFVPLAKKFVLAFKQHSLGGVVSVLVDFLHLADIDTYGVEDGVINTTVSIPDDGESHTLYVMMSDESNPAAGDTPNIQVIRKRLDETEVTPENLRWDAECNCVQQSPDDGATWVDSPTQDPRSSTIFQVPARTGGDPRCDSAQQMHDRVKNMLDAIIASSNILQAINSFIAVISVFFFELGIVIEAIWAIVSAIFSIGTTTLDAALTDAVYDALLCIFYCNIGSDGTVTSAQFTMIKSLVDSQIGGVAATAINKALDSIGFVGLTNAGALGEVTGDCSACDCGWCQQWLPSDGQAGWVFNGAPGVFQPDEWGTFDSSGWHSVSVSIVPGLDGYCHYEMVNFYKTFTAGNVTHLEFAINYLGGTKAACWSGQNDVEITGSLAGATQIHVTDNGVLDGDDQLLTWDGDVTIDRLEVRLETSAFRPSEGGIAGSVTAICILMRGFGDSPFGANNC